MTARTLAIAAAAAALLTLHAWYFDPVADDAYISLRYLESWLRGEGLVFNPGERVLGFSNALWVLALAPFGLAGLDLPSAAQGLGRQDEAGGQGQRDIEVQQPSEFQHPLRGPGLPQRALDDGSTPQSCVCRFNNHPH